MRRQLWETIVDLADAVMPLGQASGFVRVTAMELDPASHRTGQPRLRTRAKRAGQEQDEAPAWLDDYGLGGNELTNEVIEERLVPAARNVVGEQRMQMLATMVLMGMSRVVVRDGSISARLRFRAVARDKAAVEYATTSDPGGDRSWGSRGSAATESHATIDRKSVV